MQVEPAVRTVRPVVVEVGVRSADDDDAQGRSTAGREVHDEVTGLVSWMEGVVGEQSLAGQHHVRHPGRRPCLRTELRILEHDLGRAGNQLRTTRMTGLDDAVGSGRWRDGQRDPADQQRQRPGSTE